MDDYNFLEASDGTGNAVLAHITADRAIGATTIEVDSVDKWPAEFIVTTGTIIGSGASARLDPDTVTEMTAHLSGGNIEIDGFEPGHTDIGNTDGQVAIIKQTTGWANRMVEAGQNIATQLVALTGVVLPYAGAAAPTGWLLADGSAVSRTTYADLFDLIGEAFGAGNGTTTFNLPDLRSRIPVGAGAGTFTSSFASTDVNTGTDVITVPSNNSLYTGTAVVITTTGAVPTGLTAGNTYYVIRASATTIKLASSRANAVAGTAIDLTAQGSGTNTLTVTYTNHSLAAKGGEETHSSTITEMPAHTHTNEAPANATGQSGTGFNITALSGTTATGSTGGSEAHNNLQPFVALNYIIKT